MIQNIIPLLIKLTNAKKTQFPQNETKRMQQVSPTQSLAEFQNHMLTISRRAVPPVSFTGSSFFGTNSVSRFDPANSLSSNSFI